MLWLNAHYLAAFSSNMVYAIKEVIRIYTHPLKQGHHPRIVVESISRVNAYRKAKAYWLMMGYAVPNITSCHGDKTSPCYARLTLTN